MLRGETQERYWIGGSQEGGLVMRCFNQADYPAWYCKDTCQALVRLIRFLVIAVALLILDCCVLRVLPACKFIP